MGSCFRRPSREERSDTDLKETLNNNAKTRVIFLEEEVYGTYSPNSDAELLWQLRYNEHKTPPLTAPKLDNTKCYTTKLPHDHCSQFTVFNVGQTGKEKKEQLMTISDFPRLGDVLNAELLGAVKEGAENTVSKILSANKPVAVQTLRQCIDLSLLLKNVVIAKQLLVYVGNWIKKCSHNNFRVVWPAYQETDRWKPVFVALCRSNYQGEWDKCLGFRVYKRRYDYVSPDAATIINNQCVRTGRHKFLPVDLRMLILPSGIIEKHSNITIINTCQYRSRKGMLINERCIVVHCGVKGFIPFDEEPFPKYIDMYPVDVREGYFMLGMNTPPSTSPKRRRKLSNRFSSNSDSCSGSAFNGHSFVPSITSRKKNGFQRRTRGFFDAKKKTTNNSSYSLTWEANGGIGINEASGHANVDTICEAFEALSIHRFGNRPEDVNETLLMGTSISKQDNMSTGTLGGFVALPNGKDGFITCAHVLGENDGASVPFDGNEEASVCQPSDGDVRITERKTRRVCGRVKTAIFKTGSWREPGVDAAVVEITDRFPKDGQFIEVSPIQLSRAGYNPDKPPKFSAGKILKYKDIKKHRRKDVLKVGSQTGLTRGMFYLTDSFVQVSNANMALPDGRMVQFYNQLEVLSFNDSTVFFDLGDSGSLVFMPLEDDELYCVGLAIGKTTYNSCLVTPIEDVLKALNLNDDSLKNFT